MCRDEPHPQGSYNLVIDNQMNRKSHVSSCMRIKVLAFTLPLSVSRARGFPSSVDFWDLQTKCDGNERLRGMSSGKELGTIIPVMWETPWRIIQRELSSGVLRLVRSQSASSTQE